MEITPNLVPVVADVGDMMDLNVTSEEGFLLSRIDGLIRVRLICEISGLGEAKTLAVLKSLHEKGMIALHDPDQAQTGPDDDEASAEMEDFQTASAAVSDFTSLRMLLHQPLPRGQELIAIVDRVFVNLENLSYYDLLGISLASNEREIKKAYLFRSKSFHPDRFYRNVNQELKDKVQEVFKQINLGHRVLLDPKARRAYDDTLKGVEELEIDPIGAAPISTRSRSVKGESPWKRVRMAKHKAVEERTRKRRREQEKKKPSGPMLKLDLKDGGVKKVDPLLKKIHDLKQEGMKENLDQAERFHKGAMVEAQKGNFSSARTNLKLAVQYSFGAKKYQDALKKLDADEEEFRAEREFKAGVEAQESKDPADALKHFRQALRLGVESAELFRRMAAVVMEAEKNFEQARTLALKAIELMADVAEQHLILGRAYLGLGQKKAAAIQFEKALKLDPKNKALAKELKALKRG